MEQIETADSVKIGIDGEDEKSAKIQFSIERKDPSGQKSKKEKERLPVIDLSKIEVSDVSINSKIDSVLPSLEPTPCGTVPGVGLSQINVSRDYVVLKDYIYNAGNYTITVPNGFKYDRASIPSVFWSILDKDKVGNVAPLIHDFLYRYGGKPPTENINPYKKISRLEADKLLYEIMIKCGVNRIRAGVVYRIVREFSGFAWKD